MHETELFIFQDAKGRFPETGFDSKRGSFFIQDLTTFIKRVLTSMLPNRPITCLVYSHSPNARLKTFSSIFFLGWMSKLAIRAGRSGREVAQHYDTRDLGLEKIGEKYLITSI